MESRSITTDVLIVGGGGAGLRAAIEAKEYGIDVLLASKMPASAPNSSSLAAGWFLYSKSETEESLRKQVVEEGGYLNNQKLVDIFVKEVSYRIPQLQDFGVNLQGFLATKPPSFKCGDVVA